MGSVKSQTLSSQPPSWDPEIKKDQITDQQVLISIDQNREILSEKIEPESLKKASKSVDLEQSALTDLTSVIEQIQQVLEGLQPYVASHGGRIEFVELKDSVVFIRFYGACLSCPLSFYTLTYGVERHIKSKIPSILRVEALE